MPKKTKKENVKENEEVKSGKLEDKILENLVHLQKVNLDIAEKFDSLAKQISQLLNLFETAAQSYIKQSPSKLSEKDKEFLTKIDKLLEQNKTIAKGLTLMEQKIRDKPQNYPQQQAYPENEFIPPVSAKKPLPRF